MHQPEAEGEKECLKQKLPKRYVEFVVSERSLLPKNKGGKFGTYQTDRTNKKAKKGVRIR